MIFGSLLAELWYELHLKTIFAFVYTVNINKEQPSFLTTYALARLSVCLWEQKLTLALNASSSWYYAKFIEFTLFIGREKNKGGFANLYISTEYSRHHDQLFYRQILVSLHVFPSKRFFVII